AVFQVWHYGTTGKSTRHEFKGRTIAVAYTSDGKSIVGLRKTENDTRLTFRDAATLDLQNELRFKSNLISPDGFQLARNSDRIFLTESYGNNQTGMYDIATGSVRSLSGTSVASSDKNKIQFAVLT